MIYMQSDDGAVFETEFPQFHESCKKLDKKTGKALLREQAAGELREMLKPGDTVYTILLNVSRSGMSRRIDCFIVRNGKPLKLNYWMRHLGFRMAPDGSIRADGCGMDMGFHMVYRLGQTLWPDGTPEPHGTRNGEPDSAGGYALRQEWF